MDSDSQFKKIIDITNEFKQLKDRIFFPAQPKKNIALSAIPIIFAVKDSNGAKVNRAEVIVQTTKGSISLFTDQDGLVITMISRHFLELSPVCTAEKDGKELLIQSMPLYITGGTFHVDSDNIDIIFLPLKECVKKNGIEVYFSSLDKINIDNVLDILESIKRAIIRLGIEPELPYKVYVSAETVKCPSSNILISTDNIAAIDSDLSLLHVDNAHEWTECSLIAQFPFTFDIEKNGYPFRWITEGLAEYAAWIVSKELKKEAYRLAEVKEAVAQNIIMYDLYRWHKESPEGFLASLVYPASLYLWLKIVDKCRESIVKKFLIEGSKLDNVSDENLQGLLGELTGMNISQELKNINFKDALAFMKKN